MILRHLCFRLHLIGNMSGYHSTPIHPQKQERTSRQPKDNGDRKNAANDKEIKSPTTNERLHMKSQIRNNMRSFSTDVSQSTSNLHQKIRSSLHHQQSSKHHHQQTESSSLWSANKTLLHSIRLQVINGKKIKKAEPIDHLPS